MKETTAHLFKRTMTQRKGGRFHTTSALPLLTRSKNTSYYPIQGFLILRRNSHTLRPFLKILFSRHHNYIFSTWLKWLSFFFYFHFHFHFSCFIHKIGSAKKFNTFFSHSSNPYFFINAIRGETARKESKDYSILGLLTWDMFKSVIWMPTH